MATTFTLTATTKMSINTVYSRVDELATTVESKTTSQSSAYTTGYGDNQVNMHYRAQFAVSASHQNLDLFSSLTDVFGRSIIFERVRSLLIRNLSTVDGDNINWGPLGQGSAWTDPFDDDGNGKQRIPASGAACIDAPLGVGYEITATSQVIRLEHNGTSTTIPVQIEIIGVSGDLESSSSSCSNISSSSCSSLSSSSQCTSSASSISSPMCSDSTSSSSCSSQSSISSQG